MTKRSALSVPSYRLRGRVRGAERLFLLAAREHQIGSSGDNDVILAVPGVSRQHARLVRDEDTLVIEDLGSRNGTWVNGERTDRRDVAPGDLLRFGPVKLRLEAIEDDDARLGLVLRSAAAPVTPVLDETTGFLSGVPLSELDAPQAGLVFPEGCVPGRSEAMATLYRSISALAGADLPVLIEGETGVGKEYVAHTLHLSSRRRTGPFVAINCAAIPAELLESEMFGIGEGVATGVKKRPGKFREAEGGTLLLDELAEMPLEIQAKLLRALQEKEIQPLGGRPVSVDARVVAATNRDLLARVGEGRFRRDLYYRVAGGVLRVAPLSERKEDIPPLIEHFLHQSAVAANKTIPGVTVRALQALQAYAWPGNVRELEHEVRRLAYLCADGQAIEGSLLPEAVRTGETPVRADRDPAATDDVPAPPGFPRRGTSEGFAELVDGEPDTFLLEEHVRVTERRVILRALEHVGGSQRKAAQLLGISRTTLARKIEKLGIPT